MKSRLQTRIVSSFFYYMWNAWGKEECQTIYDPMANHFWEKWEYLYQKFRGGAAERFYAELSTTNRHLLVERACELYDGHRRRDSPKYNEKQWEKFPEHPVIIIGNAPKSLANLFMAESIPFAYTSGKFIVLDSATPKVLKEYLESRGVQATEINQMTISQKEIGIQDLIRI